MARYYSISAFSPSISVDAIQLPPRDSDKGLDEFQQWATEFAFTNYTASPWVPFTKAIETI